MKKIKQVFIAIAACAGLALGVIATAEGPDVKAPAFKAQTPIAIESIGPTSLSIQSRVEYSRAVLHVSGPKGLQLRAQFAADEGVHVDLLDAEWMPIRSKRAKKAGLGSIDEKGQKQPLDGLYKYEVYFFDKGSRTRYFSGQFFVENGVAVSRETVRSRLKEARQDLAESSGPLASKRSRSVNPGIETFDPTGYMTLFPAYYPDTWITMASYDLNAQAMEYFTIGNYQGDLVFGSGSYLWPWYDPYFTPQMTITRGYYGPYGVYSSVGIGTTAPYGTLDLVNPYWATTRLANPYFYSAFMVENWYGYFDIWDQYSGGYSIVIEPGLPNGTYPLWINNTGRVGIGTTGPTAPIDVEASATSIGFGNAVARLANSAGAVAFQLDANGDGTTFWNFSSITGDSSFRISRSGTGATEMSLSASGNLAIAGDLTVVGGCTGCDAVFTPSYDLESIEDHAEFMWSNGFLPGVGPTAEGKTEMRVFEKTAGILNELEKAHIYIDQLHQYTKQLREHSQQQEITIRELQTRLEALERALKPE